MLRNFAALCLAFVVTGCVVEPAPSLDGPDAEPLPNQRAHDHYTDHNWQLEIEGVTQGAFAEVSGLDSETEVVARGGFQLSQKFVTWVERSANDRAAPQSVVLVTEEPNGNVLRYRLVGATVKAWASGSGSNNTNVEEVTLVVEKIEKG